jgi:hypothetical protein
LSPAHANVIGMDDGYVYCPDCADFRAVEIPDCPDGHGRDCPERACSTCGSALLVDSPASGTLRRRRSAVRAA